MLVETFALLNSPGTCEGLTLSTSSNYVFLKEILERIWEATEMLYDSSIFFYQGALSSSPTILQKMCLTEDSLVFRLLGSLLKRLDGVYAERYDLGISILSIYQGNHGNCLLTNEYTTTNDCASYRVTSLSALKLLIEYAYNAYCSNSSGTTILIRLCLTISDRSLFIYLIEPVGHFESAYYFDSLTNISGLKTSLEAISEWYSKQDYFVQVISSTVPTFCYLEGKQDPSLGTNSIGDEGIEPEVQLVTEIFCQSGTLEQFSWITGIQHQSLNLPRATMIMRSPKRILCESFQRQVSSKSPADALLDMQLYSAYVELDFSIGSKCASRSTSPAPRSNHGDCSLSNETSAALPMTAHVVHSICSSSSCDKESQLAVSAILEDNIVHTPMITPPSGYSLRDISAELNLTQSLRDASDDYYELSSVEYNDYTRRFILLVEQVKEIRTFTEELREKVYMLERRNTQQKLAIVSNMVSFWEIFLSSYLSGILPSSITEVQRSCPRSKSYGNSISSIRTRSPRSNSASSHAKITLNSELFDLVTTPASLFISCIKHELSLYQLLIKVYQDLDKRLCNDVLYVDLDPTQSAQIVRRFLVEETTRHKKSSSVLVKRTSSTIGTYLANKRLQTKIVSANGPSNTVTLLVPTPCSAHYPNALFSELRDFLMDSRKRILRGFEYVRRSFESQNEVKACLSSAKRINTVTRQLYGQFIGNTVSHHSISRSRSNAPLASTSSSELQLKVHHTIRAPLVELLKALTNFDSVIPDIKSISLHLSICQENIDTLKKSMSNLVANL